MWNAIIFLGIWFGLLAGFVFIMEKEARKNRQDRDNRGGQR